MRIIWAHGRATLASKPSKWTQVDGANQAQQMKGNPGTKQIFQYVQQSKKNQAKPTQTAKYQGKASMLASKRSKAKRWASRASKEASQPFGQLACQPTNQPPYLPIDQLASQPTNQPTAELTDLTNPKKQRSRGATICLIKALVVRRMMRMRAQKVALNQLKNWIWWSEDSKIT